MIAKGNRVRPDRRLPEERGRPQEAKTRETPGSAPEAVRRRKRLHGERAARSASRKGAPGPAGAGDVSEPERRWGMRSDSGRSWPRGRGAVFQQETVQTGQSHLGEGPQAGPPDVPESTGKWPVSPNTCAFRGARAGPAGALPAPAVEIRG